MKKNKNTEDLTMLKECLMETIKSYANLNFYFEKKVNEITIREAGFEEMLIDSDFVARQMGCVCDKINNSKMSATDKEYILNSIRYFIEVAVDATKVLSRIICMGEDRTVEYESLIRCTSRDKQ